MGSEYQRSTSDPNIQAENYPTQQLSHATDEDTHPRKIAPPPARPGERFEEPVYREHVSGHLALDPHAAPSFYPPDLPERQARQYTQEQTIRRSQQGQTAQANAQPAPGSRPAPVAQPQPQGYPQAGQPYYGYGYPPYQQYQPSQQAQYAPGAQQPPYAWPQPQNNQAYPGYGYAGYAPYYYQYPAYQYSWQPARPKRDTYLFVMSIISTICSGLVLASGFLCSIVLLFVAIAGPSSASASTRVAGQLFSSMVLFTALTLAGLAGGGFSLFHSIRSLLKKSSRDFQLPWFWIFLGLYVLLLAIGLATRGSSQIVTNTTLGILLIGLAGLLPALTILALAVRRIHFPRDARWPTTWRRVTVALVSGATSAILFAMIFELILGFIVQSGLHVTSFNLSDPNAQVPNNARILLYMFILVSVIAPLVEESVKPLAVIALIGRIGSAAEAFVLGLACGIGFDLIETSGYISMGYRNWVDVAIERSSAGLLHGFGAGMVALGWYFLTHKKSLARRRILIGLGCIAYAMLQHAIWNGTFVFQLLPAPVGPYLDQGKIMLGNYPMSAILLIYLAETILMLTFFLYITGRLSGRSGRSGRSDHRRPPKTSPSSLQPQQYAATQKPPTNQLHPQPVR
ncbi:MAG: hypothetical protein NVSMB44_40350 [Ktedonobacteraceae bacterium]